MSALMCSPCFFLVLFLRLSSKDAKLITTYSSHESIPSQKRLAHVAIEGSQILL